MKMSLLFLPLLLAFSGCAHSLVEQNIRSGIPDSYRQYQGGIIANPTEQDIEEAIHLGKASKDKTSVLEYAYIYKPDIDTYVFVRTPLFLIAQHAMKQAQEYREVDPGLLSYADSVEVVKIEFGHADDPNFSHIGDRSPVILLHDGVRVESIQKLPIYNGENPYEKPTALDLALEGVMEAGQQAMQAYYDSIGMDSDADTNKATGRTIKLPENSSYFAISDLQQPGKYEVVVRIEDPGVFSSSQTKEKRFEIDFSRFK